MQSAAFDTPSAQPSSPVEVVSSPDVPPEIEVPIADSADEAEVAEPDILQATLAARCPTPASFRVGACETPPIVGSVQVGCSVYLTTRLSLVGHPDRALVPELVIKPASSHLAFGIRGVCTYLDPPLLVESHANLPFVASMPYHSWPR